MESMDQMENLLEQSKGSVSVQAFDDLQSLLGLLVPINVAKMGCGDFPKLV
jgi:hypothetical protein